MTEKPRIFIRVKEASARYSLSPATINRAFRDGSLTRIKRGRATLIDLLEADQWARGDTPANSDSPIA